MGDTHRILSDLGNALESKTKAINALVKIREEGADKTFVDPLLTSLLNDMNLFGAEIAQVLSKTAK